MCEDGCIVPRELVRLHIDQNVFFAFGDLAGPHY